jgi:arsenate reductase (thioredoxin)
MAEAFARMHGGPGIVAASAGSRPSGKINPRAIEFMAERGYDLTQQHSKSTSEYDGQKVAVAVTMGCGDECPLVLAERREEWQIPDPKELPAEEYRRIRDLIETKVRELLASI